MTSEAGERYYGMFKEGRRHGHGVVVFDDGSTFDGQWQKGLRKGRGTMRWPNGDSLVGEWQGDDVKQAQFTKGALVGVDAGAVNLLRLELARADALRDTESSLPLNRRTKRHDTMPVAKWSELDALSEARLHELAGAVRVQFGARAGQRGDRLNVDVLSIVLSDKLHPLGRALADFVFLFKSIFHFSYGNVDRLLENAIDDVRSFVARLTVVCATVFPFVAERQRADVVSEIVLARLYSPLFDLFKTVNKTRDTMFTVKVDSLSAVTMRDIGISSFFWLGWKVFF